MGKLRPGSGSAICLMDSDDQNEWEAAFRSYSRSVKRLSEEKGKSGLVDLDQWWRSLPEAFASREVEEGGAYLSKEDLIRVVQWKLWIGANRPSLLAYAKSTDGKKVKAKSREAFKYLPRHSSSPLPSSPPRTLSVASGTADSAPRVSTDAVKKAIKTLSSDIKGVGPATASAVLAAWCGGCPFDADEVIDAVRRTGKREYSLNEYLEVHETLDAKASSLGAQWDAERVRKALWSRAMHSRFSMAVPAVALAPPTEPEAAAVAAVPTSLSSSSPKAAPSASSRRRSGRRIDETPSTPRGGKSSGGSNSNDNEETTSDVGEGGGVTEGRGIRRQKKKQKKS